MIIELLACEKSAEIFRRNFQFFLENSAVFRTAFSESSVGVNLRRKSSANSGVSGLADVMAASRQWNDKWGLILTPFFIFSTLLISAILWITDCRLWTRRVDCLEKGRTRQKFLIIRSIPSPSLSALPTRQMTRGFIFVEYKKRISSLVVVPDWRELIVTNRTSCRILSHSILIRLFSPHY